MDEGGVAAARALVVARVRLAARARAAPAAVRARAAAVRARAASRAREAAAWMREAHPNLTAQSAFRAAPFLPHSGPPQTKLPQSSRSSAL